MINELYTMSLSLERQGLIQPIAHRDVGHPKNNPGLMIEIDTNGNPVSIDYIDKKKFVGLFRHSKGNHKSFPVIGIKKPLLLAPVNKVLLESLAWDKFDTASKDIIISEWTKEQLLPICENNEELASLCELIRRFPKNSEETKDFNKKIVIFIHKHIKEIKEPLKKLVQDILIGSWDDNKNTYVPKTQQIIFDIDDAYNYTYNVRDERLWKFLIGKLCDRDNPANIDFTDKPMEICYLTGEKQIIENNKYPNPNLNVIGNTFLYNKNVKVESHKRYGLKGLDAYKASKLVVIQMENALAVLNDKSKEDITWTRIPGSTPIKRNGKTVIHPNLLLTYVVQAPNINEKIAKMMGNSTSHEQEKERFEVLAKQICSRLRKETEINPFTIVQVIVIHAIDKSRKQILLSQSYTADVIISGTDKWQEASKASPPIRYRFWERGEWKEVSTYCPYPGEIIDIISKQWRAEREENQTILRNTLKPSITLKDVYDIFIPMTGEKNKCYTVLEQALRSFQMLMLFMGHCDNRKEVLAKNKTAIFNTCLAASLLSILLFKLGFRKEDIMHSTGYQIGQVLKLADILHREYCKGIQKNYSINSQDSEDNKKYYHLPPQLIGNSHMAIALDSPNKALSMLSERIRIYLAWTDTEMDKKAALAKWAKNHMENICLELGTMDIPNEFNDVQKAQLFLGYLAKIKEEE